MWKTLKVNIKNLGIWRKKILKPDEPTFFYHKVPCNDLR